jgi:hypothetical protein
METKSFFVKTQKTIDSGKQPYVVHSNDKPAIISKKWFKKYGEYPVSITECIWTNDGYQPVGKIN